MRYIRDRSGSIIAIARAASLLHRAYAFFNGFIRQSIGKYATVTIGGINILNEAAQNYGHIGGAGRYQSENRFFSDPNFVAETDNRGLPENIGEQFGLPPAQVTFSLGLKIQATAVAQADELGRRAKGRPVNTR